MSALPKIPLDSSADLAFLRLQLHEALSASLTKHLPNALPEDSLRSSIEGHISSFLSRTMQDVVHNITINGMDPKPSEIAKGVQVDPESYETFDTALQADVLAKHEELEDLVTRVTTMRREVPMQVKKMHEERQRARPLPVDEELERYEATVLKEVTSGRQGLMTEPIVEIPRLEEVRSTYDKSMKILAEMKGSVGSINAKAQRANQVLSFIQQQQQAVAKP